MPEDVVAASQALRPPSGPEVLALIGEPIICADDAGAILFFNAAAEDSFGYSANEVFGQPVELLLPERYRADHKRDVRNFTAGEGVAKRIMGQRRQVWARRKTGEEFPVEAIVSRQVIEGRTYVAVALRDITERNQIEENRELVARELNHRIKNLLSVIHSLIALSKKDAENVEDFSKSLQGRLRVLGATQDLLDYRGEGSASLVEVCLRELAPYRSGGAANLAIEGPPLDIRAPAALNLALVFHELATNSAKYGALSSPNGRVALEWKLVEEAGKQLLAIGWRESGGPPVTAPTRRSFGMTLIQDAIGKSYGADVAMDFTPEGLICQMNLPVEKIQARDVGL